MLHDTSLKYRSDIDGLRALAVISVVLYHARMPGFSGGFTGVDIFFVISGFLITRIIFSELEQIGDLRIAEFYARRIRRILPSLVLVVAATLAAGCLLLSASLFEIHQLAKSAMAVMAFAANLYFFGQHDYFAAASESTPLLHCWSLAIEEQYYLFWPLLLMAAHRFGRRIGRSRQSCVAMALLLTAGSLAACAAMMDCCSVAAFFLPVTRAWELGVGSALGLIDWRRFAISTRSAQIASILGLVSIVVGPALHEGSSFPFPLALAPVGGAALVLWGNGLSADGWVARGLAARPLVSIGRVSYAWYLWHWPLLSFAHILTLGEDTLALRSVLVVASLALAYSTVWLVERPFRFGFGALVSTRTTLAFGASAAGAVVVASGLAYFAARSGLLEAQPKIAAAYLDRPARQPLCLLDGQRSGGRLEAACTSSETAGLVLWGDSLASQWSPALERIAATQGRTNELEQLTMVACPPLIGLTPTDPGGQPHSPFHACRDFNSAVFDHLAAATKSSRSLVVLAANWAARARPPETVGASRRPEFFDVRSSTMDDSLGYLESALDATLARLTDLGFAVLVVLQPPNQHRSAPACLARLGAEKCFTTLAEHIRETGPVDAALRRVAMRYDRVDVFDPSELLCEGLRCPGLIGGVIAYYDELHLSASFAGSESSIAMLETLLHGLQAHSRRAELEMRGSFWPGSERVGRSSSGAPTFHAIAAESR